MNDQSVAVNLQVTGADEVVRAARLVWVHVYLLERALRRVRVAARERP